MLRRLVAYLLGYLRIEVRGPLLAEFLNGALQQGIALWAIDRTPDRMRVTLTIRDFFALRPVARATRSRVRILRRQGFPFLLVRLKRRPILIAGVFACLAFVLWFSGHIWRVEVRISGPKNLDPRAVASVASEVGLMPGAWKSKVDVHKVEAHLLKRISEVSWAIVRVQGTRVVIEIVEKAAEKSGARSTECINLVARKAGVVESVIPFQGEAVVKQGDVVKPGDLLVECAFKYYPGGRPQVYPGTPMPPRTEIARMAPALAEVKARVTYQEYREVQLYQDVPVPTGRSVTRWVLSWKQKPILTVGAKQVEFKDSTEQRVVYPPWVWRNWRSPVELTQVKIEEVQIKREPVTVEQAVTAAREQMEARLRWLLGPSDRLLTPLRIDVVERSGDRAGLSLRVETLEEISEPKLGQPIQPEPPPPPQNP